MQANVMQEQERKLSPQQLNISINIKYFEYFLSKVYFCIFFKKPQTPLTNDNSRVLWELLKTQK